jgi:D-3-phosphoglycerate dehydrogenase
VANASTASAANASTASAANASTASAANASGSVPAKKPTVLCTLPIDPAGVALLAPLANVVVADNDRPETLRAAIGDADYLIVRTKLPDDLFDRPNRLLGVVRNGSGLDMIPVESATKHGIPVANVPGANAQAVVEYCIGSMLLLARRFAAMDQTLRKDGWAAARTITAGATELSGKTVGIVGLGAIGAELARLCAHGFGMRVLAHAKRRETIPSFAEPVEVDELVAQSDFISLNCPLTPETTHLIDERRLRLMKPTAYLVNAARGAVVDEAALVRALQERWIAGAALDVFTEQPLRADHPFLALDNVILTPHSAALTQESSRKMSAGAARQVLQLMAGERPEHLVNPEVWPHFEQRRATEGAPLAAGTPAAPTPGTPPAPATPAAKAASGAGA